MSLSKIKKHFKLDKMLNIFKWVVIVYAMVTFISFIIIIADKSPLPHLSSSGLEGFFSLFEYPIKLTTGLIALLAILLTALRMEQTQKQIDILDDNNRFNNFYRHREEFEKAFKGFVVIKGIIQYENDHMKNRQIAPDKKKHLLGNRLLIQAMVFYSDLYYKNYKNFKTNFNKDISQKIIRIKKTLSELPIVLGEESKEVNNKSLDFSKISEEKLYEIISQFPSSITYVITHMARIDLLEFKSHKIDNGNFGYTNNLNVCYWGILFIREFMRNDGIDSAEMNSFIYQYNGIRGRKELYTIY